eukprot:15477659-Alexandrium_andersonii.AAC.1
MAAGPAGSGSGRTFARNWSTCSLAPGTSCSNVRASEILAAWAEESTALGSSASASSAIGAASSSSD